MEFNQKLQELRKSQGLTQEELANSIYVSRTAISKWESGRGYPSIDSLKAISEYFSVTIDTLLSGDEVLAIAEEDHKQKNLKHRDLIFGLLDIGVVLLLFLPLFGQMSNNTILSVPLSSLSGISNYLLISYYFIIAATILCGILTLALQECNRSLWIQMKTKISFGASTAGVLLFSVSTQPYATIFSFVFLLIKVLVIVKKQ